MTDRKAPLDIGGAFCYSGTMDRFMWYGQELNTMGEIMEEALHLVDLGDEIVAAEFIDDYGAFIMKSNPHLYEEGSDCRLIAQQNLGYLAGYLESEDRQRLYDFFNIGHPIFGRDEPTPEEAFEIGKEWGQAIKEGRPFP